MSGAPTEESKNISIISYLTIIGFIIAFVMHNKNKTDFSAFHIRQAFGISVLSLIAYPFAGFPLLKYISFIVFSVYLILLILGILSAARGEKTTVPVIGKTFQEIFKGIG